MKILCMHFSAQARLNQVQKSRPVCFLKCPFQMTEILILLTEIVLHYLECVHFQDAILCSSWLYRAQMVQVRVTAPPMESLIQGGQDKVVPRGPRSLVGKSGKSPG